MEFAQIYLTHQSEFKIAYALIVFLIAMFITYKVNRFYKYSQHRGIKLFGLTFLCFGTAFFIEGLTEIILIYTQLLDNFILLLLANILFRYLMMLSVTLLVYSMLWKKFNDGKKQSLIRMIMIHFFAITIASIDFLTHFIFTKHISFLFISAILILGYGTLLSYQNYQKSPTNHYKEMYFIALVLMLIGWTVNYLSFIISAFIPTISFYAKIITLAIFGIFLFGVSKK